ncbi:MAG: hypothetical protein IV100_27500 [Myxococcales bacterium]|nr:hypothetical protein [Myxococcales bacterium]
MKSPFDARDPRLNGTREVSAAAKAGARRSAIALMMLGPDIASEILRELTDEEMEVLLKTAAEVRTVEESEVIEILEEYSSVVEGQALLLTRADSFVTRLAEDTFGRARVRNLLGLDRPADPPPPPPALPEPEPGTPLRAAVHATPEALANVLKKEHPQTVAVALAVMPQAKASAVLNKLPAEMRPDLIRRIAQTGAIPPALLHEIDEILLRELESGASRDALTVDGTSVVVGLLKGMSQSVEEEIFKGLTDEDPVLSDAIRRRMFTFEDLIGIDGRALQQVLKEIDGKTLTLSLKTASMAMREHVLASMSSRAATMILEDLEAMGPVAVNVLQTAQDEVVQVALRLASEGKLVIR